MKRITALLLFMLLNVYPCLLLAEAPYKVTIAFSGSILGELEPCG